jgi:hypothetical protein
MAERATPPWTGPMFGTIILPHNQATFFKMGKEKTGRDSPGFPIF